MNLRIVFLLPVLCCVAGSAVGGDAAAPSGAQSFAYTNPIEFEYAEGQTAPRREVRDPCIVRDGGAYHLIFTMYPFSNRDAKRLDEPNEGGAPGIAMYVSKDLHHWRFESWLVRSSTLPRDCPYKDRFWAPEIHKIGGRYYLIFTADNWIEGRYNAPGTWGTAGYSFIGVADHIAGPYRHVTYVPGGTCDMTLFVDDDAQTWAIKPEGDIYIQKIDLSRIEQDRVSLVGEQRRIVTASNADIALPTSPDYLEGPWLEKIGRRYCLFYAEIYKDRAHPELLGYRTNAAYADSLSGPWKKDPRGAVFFGGHLAVFDGPGDRKWFSYRWEKDDRARGLLCIDPLRLDADGRVQADATLHEKQTISSLSP